MTGSFWGTWGTAIVSILVGAAVTWAAAWYYFKRAGDELRAESQQLRKLISMVLLAMERQGSAKLNRDPDGNIIGFVFEYVGSGGLQFGGKADAQFIPAKGEHGGSGSGRTHR